MSLTSSTLIQTLWIATAPTGVPSYDFAFETFFPCRRPWMRPDSVVAVGLFGVTDNYAELYQTLAQSGITLIHAPEQYLLTSELPYWYPLIADLTPRSMWFEQPPTVTEVKQHFSWPIFVKGSRQTSKHRASFSIIHSSDEYERVREMYQHDPILHRQPMVCREFVILRAVSAPPSDTIPPSFEFRTFWWRGEYVGGGPYWSAFARYTWTRSEEQAAVQVAAEAAQRLNVPFLVVDVAQTSEGEWIIIECNDGQESGYAGVAPIALWQRIIEIERRQQL